MFCKYYTKTLVMEIIRKKILYTFNKLSLDFIKELKKQHDQLKVHIGKKYRTFDKSSDKYLEKFWENIPEDVKPMFFIDISSDLESSLIHETKLKDWDLLNELTLAQITKLVSDDNYGIVSNYVYMLYLFAHLYKDTELSEDQLDDIFKSSLKVLGNPDECIVEVIDDDIQNIWNNMTAYKTKVESFDMFENSKIGQLAKEITEEIDIDSINPEDLMNMNNLFGDQSGSPNILGDVISKVGASIGKKIQNGDIKQDDLIKDAMSMLGQMGGNNPFASMFGADFMNDMMPQQNNNKTKQRLQKKLQEKK